MLAGVALIPGPPLLVPELIGSAAAETADLRTAVLAAGAKIADADRWIALGVGGDGEPTGGFGPETVGTYRGFGAEVTVRLSGADTDEATEPDPRLPLAALTVGWLRDRVAPAVPARVVIVPPETNTAESNTAESNTAERQVVDDLIAAIGADARIGLVIVGDGARTLTERAPGGLHPDGAAVQSRLDDLLAAADLIGLGSLDPDECARVGVGSATAWRIAATVLRALDEPLATRELYRGHPFGVGYWVGTWMPEHT